jgi:hypothetical protein
MEQITQQITVKEWPLAIGQELFLGYVVAMGVFPRSWSDDNGMIPYVDFAYNESYERYRLPDDEDLIKQLHAILRDNLSGQTTDAGDICGQVWIRRDKSGHTVEMP